MLNLRKTASILLIVVLLSQLVLVWLPHVKAEGISSIHLVLLRVRELDAIETLTWPPPFGQDGADWFFKVQFYDGQNWRDWEQERTAGANNPDAGPLWEWFSYEFKTPLDLLVKFRILLYDHDLFEIPDLADISSKVGEGVKDWDGSYRPGAVFEGVYDMETRSFTSDGDRVEMRWYDKISKYVWVTSGEFDGSYGAVGLDAEVWFDVLEELPDEIKPWLDQNRNGIPDYLDVLSFDVKQYSVDNITIPFGSFVINWPVDLQIIYPANTQDDMLNQFRSWGVDIDRSYYYVLPIIFDINITSLTSQFSMIFPWSVLNYLRGQACWDGRLRLLSFFTLDTLRGYQDYIDILLTLKQLLLGNDIFALESLFDYVDISFYVMRYTTNVIADKVVSLQELFANKLVQLLIDWIQIVIELPTLPENIINIATKIFSFIVDYTLDYLPIPAEVKDSANWIKGILNQKDPPEIRLDLRVHNASTGNLLLGYDTTTGEKLTTCSINGSIFGLWFEDADKQIFIVAKSLAPYNISISCNGSSGTPENVTYSFVLFDPTFTESYVFGGVLTAHEKRESPLTLGVDNKTQVLGLKLWSTVSSKHPTRGEKVQIDINVTDMFNNPVDGSNVTLYIDNKPVSVTSLGNGKFKAIVDTSTSEGLNLLYAYATKKGYLDGIDVLSIEVESLQLFKLIISATAGGITNPSPGEYSYPLNSLVQIEATPSSGYNFDHWELNGTDVGSTNPYTMIMDSNYHLKALFALKPQLMASITPTSASILVGQKITLTSTVYGGSPPYTYQWYLNNATVPGATSASWTFTPTSAGIYFIHLKITDSEGNTARSDLARIAVATVPVGGYSITISKNTKPDPDPTTLYIMLVAAITITCTTIKRKTNKKPKT